MSTVLRLAVAAVTVSLLATIAFICTGDLSDGSAAADELTRWVQQVGDWARGRPEPNDSIAAEAVGPAVSPLHAAVSPRPGIAADRAASAVSRGPAEPSGPALASPEPAIQTSQFTNVAAPGPNDESGTGVRQAEQLKTEATPMRDSSQSKATAGSKEIEFIIRDKDISYALELLSRVSGRTILASKNVTGPITLVAPHTTADEALEKILKITGYIAKKEGEYTLIYDPKDLKEIEEREYKPEFWTYRPKYVAAIDLKDLLVVHLSPAGKITSNKPNVAGIAVNADGDGGDTLAVADTIVVQDIKPVIEELKRIVAEVDVRPIQVLIETVILQVDLNDEHQMGVNLALLSGSAAVSLVGNGALVNGAVGFRPSQVITDAGKLQGALADNTHGLKSGVINGDVTGFIRMLESIGHTQILNCTKGSVLNKQRLDIHVGSQLGYRTTTITETSTTETVQFLDLGTQLRVRPFVQPAGLIRMELHPEKSSGSVSETTGLPEKQTAQVTTNLTVPSGMTLVIGGLIEEQQQRTVQQVPFLGSLPWLGRLFRDETATTSRHELIVLVTPRILAEEESAAEAQEHLERFGDRFDQLERTFPNSSRIALSRQYYDKACACREQGDMKTAMQMVELSLDFDPTNVFATQLRKELIAACLGGAEAGRSAADSDASSPPAAPAETKRTAKRNSLFFRR